MVTHACSASSSGGLDGKKCWLHLRDKEYKTQSPALPLPGCITQTHTGFERL